MTSTLSRPSAATLRSQPNPTTRRRFVAETPRSRTHLPTRLRPADLLRITDQGVADVLDGRHDHLLPAEWDPVQRWSTRIHADDDVDVWLISWTPGEATELHDHAGSLGALTVLSGSLREYHWTGEKLDVRVLDAGDQAAFPLGWVHDVVQNPSITVTGPTLSVHAYSPPLTAMSYYEVAEGSHLRRTRTVLTDEPE
ncbi:cysteine dioxygenase [Gordonia paraffinivorans]|uniref:cysteine dioxygenase n=1 Tax=Gordonia paraffinivorans TaxID=175628 RepID=UPI001446B418|nr:cysteine dioxygenase family protein [Gordonia paraffinivorans]